MTAYFEVVTRDDMNPADGIDYKGICAAFDDLGSAIEYAEAVGAACVSEIGGAWDEWEKCTDCGEWFPSVDLDRAGMCAACATVERDHGRRAER